MKQDLENKFMALTKGGLQLPTNYNTYKKRIQPQHTKLDKSDDQLPLQQFYYLQLTTFTLHSHTFSFDLLPPTFTHTLMLLAHYLQHSPQTLLSSVHYLYYSLINFFFWITSFSTHLHTSSHIHTHSSAFNALFLAYTFKTQHIT